jgi:hypothetical protein
MDVSATGGTAILIAVLDVPSQFRGDSQMTSRKSVVLGDGQRDGLADASSLPILTETLVRVM